jgi:hypothetical protein
MVGEHDEDKEHPQTRGGDRQQIDGDQVADVVGEEARSRTVRCAACPGLNFWRRGDGSFRTG